jgi:hypothetical protein
MIPDHRPRHRRLLQPRRLPQQRPPSRRLLQLRRLRRRPLLHRLRPPPLPLPLPRQPPQPRLWRTPHSRLAAQT